MVDLTNLEHREVALTVLGRADEPGDRVSGAKIKASYLTRRHVDVVGSG